CRAGHEASSSLHPAGFHPLRGRTQESPCRKQGMDFLRTMGFWSAGPEEAYHFGKTAPRSSGAVFPIPLPDSRGRRRQAGTR
ncbi:MAG: hypothetical protein II687_03010, partial [Selenomonadaceae bacterium]|nr:hypothetical protein [Selenomonadaceae bacterium]